MNISEVLKDKRILIFGYGREGKSTEEYIKKHVEVKSLDIFEGKIEDIDESKYDLIIKSPGIVMLEDNKKYTSQTELFLNEFSDKTVGVTGTKGKSTTASMIYHTLKEAGKDAVLLGNIGKPCFDLVDEIKDDTIVVFELSCHQLLHIDKAPHIAVFLNLFEEHLDYYKTLDNYFNAKANIISHQTEYDIAYVGENVPEIDTKSDVNVISSIEHDFNLQIKGEHNKLNAEFVYRICVDEFMLSPESAMKGVNSFKGLPHRLEKFASKNGVDYYDDSISTIPEALINALHSVDNAKVVIVGGMDRGIDYSILSDFINENKNYYYILCYATGERIYKNIKDNADVFLVKDIDEAYSKSLEIAKEGDAVILSPAAPSYGYFKNFEERGDYFKNLVNSL